MSTTRGTRLSFNSIHRTVNRSRKHTHLGGHSAVPSRASEGSAARRSDSGTNSGNSRPAIGAANCFMFHPAQERECPLEENEWILTSRHHVEFIGRTHARTYARLLSPVIFRTTRTGRIGRRRWDDALARRRGEGAGGSRREEEGTRGCPVLLPRGGSHYCGPTRLLPATGARRGRDRERGACSEHRAGVRKAREITTAPSFSFTFLAASPTARERGRLRTKRCCIREDEYAKRTILIFMLTVFHANDEIPDIISLSMVTRSAQRYRKDVIETSLSTVSRGVDTSPGGRDTVMSYTWAKYWYVVLHDTASAMHFQSRHGYFAVDGIRRYFGGKYRGIGGLDFG